MTMKHYRTDGIVVSMHNKGSLMTNPSHEAHVQALMTKPSHDQAPHDQVLS